MYEAATHLCCTTRWDSLALLIESGCPMLCTEFREYPYGWHGMVAARKRAATGDGRQPEHHVADPRPDNAAEAPYMNSKGWSIETRLATRWE